MARSLHYQSSQQSCRLFVKFQFKTYYQQASIFEKMFLMPTPIHNRALVFLMLHLNYFFQKFRLIIFKLAALCCGANGSSWNRDYYLVVVFGLFGPLILMAIDKFGITNVMGYLIIGTIFLTLFKGIQTQRALDRSTFVLVCLFCKN